MTKGIKLYFVRLHLCEDCRQRLERRFPNYVTLEDEISPEGQTCDLCREMQKKVTVTKSYEHLPL